MTAEKEIISKLQELTSKAYVPVSGYKFRCAIETRESEVFYGVNWELADYRLGSCAEGSAVSDMITMYGPSFIKNIWLMGDEEDDSAVKSNCPCGICRQVLSEFTNKETMIHLISPYGRKVESIQFQSLIPRAFNYQSYLDGIPELLRKPKNRHMGGMDLRQLLKNSYCPDIGKHEVCSLELENGDKIEGVSYSTASMKGSVSSIKSALSRLITHHGYRKVISAIFLDEKSKNAKQGLSAEDVEYLNNFDCTSVHYFETKGEG